MAHFVTYGDEKYSNSKKRIVAEASPFFDEIHVYGPSDVEMSTSKQTRGGGYWIWKPRIIKDALERMKDGEVLVYADSGCTINASAHNRLKEYLNTKCGLFFQLEHLEKFYTKEDVFKYFSAPAMKETPMIMATSFVLRKTPESVQLVDAWCSVPEILFTDAYTHANDSCFIDHRHDQSILSVLVKLNPDPFTVIKDETWPFFPQFPIHATRIRG